jgi:hypothetical protein
MTLDTVWHYTGAFALALLIIYGIRNYWITLVGGLIVFCVFYFSYVDRKIDPGPGLRPALIALKEAAMIYLISYVFAAVVYTLTNRVKKNKMKKR